MKNLILNMLLIAIISCNPQKSIIKQQRISWGYKNWVKDFKDRTFCKCLLVGYGQKRIVDSIYEIDKIYYNPIAIAIFDLKIDSVLQKELLKMRSDSLLSISIISEAAAGKTVFRHCLNFYKSKELNSVVKMESLKWSRISNIDSLVYKTIPTF